MRPPDENRIFEAAYMRAVIYFLRLVLGCRVQRQETMSPERAAYIRQLPQLIGGPADGKSYALSGRGFRGIVLPIHGVSHLYKFDGRNWKYVGARRVLSRREYEAFVFGE